MESPSKYIQKLERELHMYKESMSQYSRDATPESRAKMVSSLSYPIKCTHPHIQKAESKKSKVILMITCMSILSMNKSKEPHKNILINAKNIRNFIINTLLHKIR